MYYEREEFLRGQAISEMERRLPGPLYNRMKVLLGHSESGALFVPIRSLQYMAVIDDEEVIFVDGMRRHLVAVSWTRFRPSVRAAIDEAVPCAQLLYQREAEPVLSRLSSEFMRALQEYDARQPRPTPGRVVAFRR